MISNYPDKEGVRIPAYCGIPTSGIKALAKFSHFFNEFYSF